jgi:hypothetical protein
MRTLFSFLKAMTQILVLDRNPERAARKFRSRKLHSKLFVECMQLLGQALRNYGMDHTLLAKNHNPAHLCVIWAQASKAHFRWALKHARELHSIFEKHIQKQTTPHKTLARLEYLEQLVKDGGLPASMPEAATADEVYDKIEEIRNRQHPAARTKSGKVLRATTGLPEGCTSVALAINQEFQDRGCVVYTDDGQIDGVKTYEKYHLLKVPELHPNTPWMEE